MKKTVLLLAVVLVLGLTMSSCVTGSNIAGHTSYGHGFFTIGSSGMAEAIGATEIGSYKIILGLISSGFPEYSKAISDALAEGKQVSVERVDLLGLVITYTAYAK